ncbi:hypothetical protein [Sphingobacterium paucimobilis]|nr:hypothetical protein [Sphingobacterium paucimobilis]
MTNVSITAQVSKSHLINGEYHRLYQDDLGGYDYTLFRTPSEILLEVNLRNGRLLLARLSELSDPSSTTIHCKSIESHRLDLEIECSIGLYRIHVQLHGGESVFIHYTMHLEPKNHLTKLPNNPEVLILEDQNYKIPPEGTTYHMQKQLRSGACFTDFGQKSKGTLLYFQDLSSLNKYAEHTQQSLSDVVSMQWPELGLSLPQSDQRAIQKGERYKLCHAYLIFEPTQPKDSIAMSRRYIRGLASIYEQLERPAIRTLPLPRYAHYALQGLVRTHGCWQQVEENAYLNAYLNDYETPPESMVQLAVLTPLVLHSTLERSNHAQQVIGSLTAGLSNFFDPILKAFVRWIPNKEHHLDHSEEQKKPRVMDSWYLQHPLIQLASLLEAKHLDADLENKFYQSLRFCIKVAHHFEYNWPIFYDLDTLEIIKEEAQPGQGGEKDVAGMYAYLMLKAYTLSGKKIYLTEAKRAAKTLFRFGFDLIYQSNNTAYAAEALLQLWVLTKEKKYLDYSELCLGNLLRNTGIWQRAYGNSKEYPTFFCLYPLTDAPYSAVFEEQETLASFHRYLRMAHTEKAPVAEDLQALMAEYTYYASCRLAYYLPSLLPKDILATRVKTGYLDAELWMPIEDLGDGWEAVGQVGQEVYGAGFLFQLIRYHYLSLDDTSSCCYIGYPYIEIDRKDQQVKIQVLGSSDYGCIVQVYGMKSNACTITLKDGSHYDLTKDNNRLKIKGAQEITIKWKS